MEGYKSLIIWKLGIELSLVCYKLTSKFPQSEIYGLTSQINRATVSVPANIAEGYGRHSNKEFIYFLYIALGSCNEVETLLLIGHRLNYFDDKEYSAVSELRHELGCKLSAFINSRKERG